MNGQPYALATSPDKQPPVMHQIAGWLAGLQSQTGSCGEEKNFLTLPGIESCTVQPTVSLP